jgi:RNA polymerase sigma-70 factor (ECF subfamily)
MVVAMPSHDAEIEALIERAAGGDKAARQELLLRHEQRLRQMIAVRLDHRLAARLDPSDVVQEVFADACRKLSDYLRRRPLPFYPWLRQLAWERLVKLHQRHIGARKRSVTREENPGAALSDESALALAERLSAPGPSPSSRLLREELSRRVRDALDRLAGNDREVLVMRYLEQLSTREIAAILGLSEGAVKVRHLRALERLRGLLSDEPREDET